MNQNSHLNFFLLSCQFFLTQFRISNPNIDYTSFIKRCINWKIKNNAQEFGAGLEGCIPPLLNLKRNLCIHVNVIVDRLVEIQPLSLVVTENWSKCKKENSRNFQQFGCILDETYHDSLKNNSKKYDCIGKFEPSKQN